MPTWGIGDHHDSDEVRTLKEQILSKDAANATLHGELLKREGELKELTESFNNALEKLRKEADRVVKLDGELQRRNQELSNEQLTRANAEIALTTANDKLKETEQASLELQSTIYTLSSSANSSSRGLFKLESDNNALQARVRALEQELQNKEENALRQSQNQSASGRHRRLPSDSTSQLPALQRELTELRSISAQQASELDRTTQQLARTRDSLVQLQNEKTASERRLQRQLDDAQAVLEDRDEDLRLLKVGDGGEDVAKREADLLERLEEEEKRVAALEEQLSRSTGSKRRDMAMLQGELDRTLQLLDDANAKLAAAGSNLTRSASERRLAIAECEDIRREKDLLSQHIQAAEARISELELELSTSAESTMDSATADATTATINKLLGAIERLRSERDDRHRDIEFLTLEHKFAMQAMEEKLRTALSASASATSAPASVPMTPAVDHAYIAIVEGHAQAFQEQAERSERAAIALAVVAQHAACQEDSKMGRIDQLVDQLAVTSEHLRQAEHILEEHRQTITSLREQLTLSQDNHTITARLHETIGRLEHELSEERNSHADTGAALSDTEAQLSALSDALAETEAARDALALEKSHLESDLEVTRNQLADAEERHSEQLAALSAAGQSGHGAQAAALRAHIRDLEERVLRRTEQIGVHQHEIKRLDTNMKLQEDRIVEMTQELEVFQNEKVAMLEDCRTTREERDDAMRKCDELEEAMEVLEEARESEVQAVVRAAFGALATKRDVVVRSRRVLGASQGDRVQLAEQVHAAEAAKAALVAQIAAMNTEHDATSQIARGDLESLRTQLDEASAAAQAAQDAKSAIEVQLATLHTNIESKNSELVSLRNQLAIARADQADRQSLEANLFAQEKADLEEKLERSRTSYLELDALYQESLKECQRVEQVLMRTEAELAEQLVKNTAHCEAEQRLHEEITQAKKEHAEEAAALEEHLKDVSDELEAMTHLRAEADASRAETQEELVRTKEQLEARLAEVQESIDSVGRLEAELEEAKVAHDEDRRSLRATLDTTTVELQEIMRQKEELRGLHEEAIEQCHQHAQHVADARTRTESLETQLSELRNTHREELRSLEERLEDAERQILETKATADNQQREAVDELARTVEELKDRLLVRHKELDECRSELEEEKSAHARTRSSTSADLRELMAMRDEAESALVDAERELPAVRAQLEHVESSLREMEEEKLSLQYQVTNLEAEVQRAKSLQRFLESQASDSERRVSSLETELGELRSKCTALDKVAQTKEANLAMQTIHHEQTVASLKRELNALRTQPHAEEEIATLKEKNTEYEELLRSKCLEIEENDDRFIEMLKEKKKLNNKVESLTRKVQSLQSKLTVVTEAAEKAPVASIPVVPAIALRPPPVFSPSPVLAPAPVITGPSASTSRPTSRQRVVTAPAAPPLDAPSIPPLPMPEFRPRTPESRFRMMSGPSSINRPKTPESRVPLPVFKARTPEHRRTPSSSRPTPTIPESSSSSSMIGVKRRAPDDFDDCSALPAQTFTPDSAPLVYNAEAGSSALPTTPRLRKALQSVRTGFTPVRHMGSRAGSASPRRATTGAHIPASMPHTISDVTNSPRAASHSETTAKPAPPKKGWLGKIKAGPAHASRMPGSGSRQPTFGGT